MLIEYRHLYEAFFWGEKIHLYKLHLISTDLKKDLRALEDALPMPPRKANIKISSLAALRSCD